jgi:hypothetical protein
MLLTSAIALKAQGLCLRCIEITEVEMNELVARLCTGSNPVTISLRPERTASALKQRIEKYGFVHIKFTDTRGGTELGVRLDKEACNLAAADFEQARGKVTLCGRLRLNYVPVECIAEIDLSTLEGTGYLRKIENAVESGSSLPQASTA